MKPTLESLAALHQSAEMLGAVVRRAEEADVLEAALAWPDPLDPALLTPPKVVMDHARRLADWMAEAGHVNWRMSGMCSASIDERAGKEIAALRLEVADLKHSLKLAGEQADRLRSTLDAYKESCRSLEGKVATLTAEAEGMQSVMREAVGRVCCINGDIAELRLALREARAENGRQAAVIAAMRADGKPLRLEVGKTYVRRDGLIDAIISTIDSADEDFNYISQSGKSYRENGRYCVMDGHPADLVAEAPAIDPASPHP